MAVIVVANASQFNSAMNSIKGGDTIVLKGGNYGNLNISKNFTTPVKIVSESDTNPAVFTGMVMKDSSNIKIDGVKFDYVSKSGDPLHHNPFGVFDSKNITITNSTFDGDVSKGAAAVDAGFGNGRGLNVRESEGVEISNNFFTGFHRGAVFDRVTGLKVSGNEVTDMSTDGFDFSEVQNVLVSGNHMHDFHMSALSKAHPDFIQFFSGKTGRPSANIKIVDNFLDQGEGIWTQSIFMRNEAVDIYGRGLPLFYKDITIENNVIRNGHQHGITVGQTIGLMIKNNTVITHVQGDVVSQPTINLYPKSQLVQVIDNLTNGLKITLEPGWVVNGNYLVQNINPVGPDYIGNIFADPFDKIGTTLDDFKFIPGSIVGTLGVGSTLSKYVGGVSGLILNKATNSLDPLDQTFDASNLIAAGSKINLAGAKIVWDFGDGNVGTGLKATNSYDAPGVYTATLTITLANGKVISADKTVIIKNTNILDMDFTNGIIDTSTVPNALSVDRAKVLTLANGDKVLDLNGGKVSIKTDHEFFNNSEYTFVADFKKDVGAESKTGRLAYFGGSLIVTVQADGLEALVRTSKGTHLLKAYGLGIKDTDWHRVGVTFSGETGFAKLYLDGNEVATIGGLEGAFQPGTRAATFNIGGLYGHSFDGKIDNVSFFGDEMPASFLTPDSTFSAKVNLANAATSSAAGSAMAAAAAAVIDDTVGSFVAAKTAAPVGTLDQIIDSSGNLVNIANLLPTSAYAADLDFRLI